MRTVVFDLDGGRHRPRRFGPLLYPLMRGGRLAWLPAVDGAELQSATASARALALAHRGEPWQALFIMDMEQPVGAAPLARSLRQVFVTLHQDCLEPLGSIPPRRAIVIAMDGLARESHTGRPLEAAAAARWELDSSGVLRNPPFSYLFSEDDAASVDAAWGNVGIDFAGAATHGGLAGLQPALREEIQRRSSAVEARFTEILSGKVGALTQANAVRGAVVTSQDLEVLKTRFLGGLAEKLDAGQVAPLADFRPGRDLLRPLLNELFSAARTRGNITLVRLPRVAESELELTLLVSALSVAPMELVNADASTCRAVLRLDRGGIEAMYLDHVTALADVQRTLETQDKTPDKTLVSCATDPSWVCREEPPTVADRIAASFPSMQSSRDQGIWKSWLQRAISGVRGLNDSTRGGLAKCRRDADDIVRQALAGATPRESSEEETEGDIERLDTEIADLQRWPQKRLRAEAIQREWQREVDAWQKEFPDTAGLRPTTRTFVVGCTLGLLTWLSIASVGAWRDVVHTAGWWFVTGPLLWIVVVSVLSACAALWKSGRPLIALSARAANVHETTGRKIVEAFNAARDGLQRVQHIALKSSNRRALDGGLQRLRLTRRQRRYHLEAVGRHLQQSIDLARQFSSGGVRKDNATLLWPDLDTTRPDFENMRYAPNGAEHRKVDVPASISVGGRVYPLDDLRLCGLSAVELVSEPLQELGLVK